MNWNINMIQALDEAQVKAMAKDMFETKGHQIYLVDFGGYFGFSALVFYKGAHLYYANDYELHHNGKKELELRALYVDKMQEILFDDEDFGKPLASYKDYHARDYYLRSYYPQRTEYVSAFYIARPGEEDNRPDTSGLFYDPVCFAHFKDAEFVKLHIELFNQMEAQMQAMRNNAEYWKSAFLYEMHNHEYGINWQGDYDVVSVFANVRYAEGRGVMSYLKAAKFTQAQIDGYLAARAQYHEETKDLY